MIQNLLLQIFLLIEGKATRQNLLTVPSTAAILNLDWIYKNAKFVNEDAKEAKFWQKRAGELSEEELAGNYELIYALD